MPRPRKSTILVRLGGAIADLLQDLIDTVLPEPEPDPIPVRVKERR